MRPSVTFSTWHREQKSSLEQYTEAYAEIQLVLDRQACIPLTLEGISCFTDKMHAEHLGCYAVHPSVLDIWPGRLG